MKHQAEDHPKQALATGRIAGEGGFSMIATALGLAATAILTAVLLGTMLDSNGTTANGISSEPGVAEAGALQAQQTLTTGLTTVDTAAISGGGYGSLQPSALTASNPSITFVAGPSTNSDTISMAVTSGSGGQAGVSGANVGNGGGVSGGVGGGVGGAGGIADAVASAGAGNAAGAGTSAGSGTVTLADRSTDGTCWLVWKGAGGSTWYGAETGLESCTAPAISSTPSPGPVSSSSIGWKQGAFPGA